MSIKKVIRKYDPCGGKNARSGKRNRTEPNQIKRTKQQASRRETLGGASAAQCAENANALNFLAVLSKSF